MYTSDTLNRREAYIVTGKKVTSKLLVISVGNSLPMMITIPNLIKEVTLATQASPAITDEDFDISDPEYLADKGEERYVLVTVAQSPLTNNRAVFYYDKLFSDIIVLPNVAFLDLFDGNFTYKLGAYHIGVGHNLTNSYPHQTLGLTQANTYKLPEANSKITNESYLVRLPGYIPENLLRNNAIEEMITDKLNLIRNNIQPGVLVKLGTADTIFKNVTALPLYLLAQTKLTEYSLTYINNVTPTTQEIYVSLVF